MRLRHACPADYDRVLPVWLDCAGAGGHRVVFRREVVLGAPTAPAELDAERVQALAR